MSYNCKYCNANLIKQVDASSAIVCDSCKKLHLINSNAIWGYIAPNTFINESNENYSLTFNSTNYAIIGAITGIYSETRLALFNILMPTNKVETILYYDHQWYQAKEYTNTLKQPNDFIRASVSDVVDTDEFGTIMQIANGNWRKRKYYNEITHLDFSEETDYQEWTNEKMHLLLAVHNKTVLHIFEVSPIQLENYNLPPAFLKEEKAIQCHNCTNIITNKLYPIVQSAICSNCNTPYIFKDSILEKADSITLKQNAQPDIEIGQVLELNMAVYSVIGFLTKKDSENYTWNEYTLWSEIEGIAFLSEYNGHFSFIKRRKLASILNRDHLLETERTFERDKNIFQLFNNYNFEITSGVGIYHGNVFNDGRPASIEYISPPFLRNYEFVLNESVEVYDGQYVSHEELCNNPGVISSKLPRKKMVGATQPIGNNYKNIIVSCVIFVAVLIISFSITSISKNPIKIIDNRINTADSVYKKFGHTFPDFSLPNWRNSLHLEIYAPVSNSWLEANVELTNIESGKTIVFEKGVEFWSGIEDGYSWSEGSTTKKFVIENLPKATYQLGLTTTSSDSTISEVDISVVANKTLFRNLWLPLLIVIIPLVIYLLYLRENDKLRWFESPYGTNDY
jgi:hypothetical protein